MANYTTNIAQNPGMQNGLSGYSTTNNATLLLSPLGTGGTLFGNEGLLVTTPGNVSGEGVNTPASTVQTTTAHSASVYINGVLPGKVTVSVVSNPGQVILSSVPVTLTTAYQRVVINNFPAVQGNTLSLLISTTTKIATQFWITNIQIESEALTHPYCDGGQPGCFWLTTVGGISYQPYQNTLIATANIIDSSNIVSILLKGKVFNIATTNSNIKDTSNLVSTIFTAGPAGAMTDFSVAALTDPDPAQTYTSWNNSGITVPTSGYARVWGTFYPPQDYFVSNNAKLYSRAAFMATGIQFTGVPNNASIAISDIQTEILPITTGFTAPAPSTFNLPRAISTIIKPDRLNYCPNPSFEVSAAGWSAVAGGVLSVDPTVFVGNIISIDDIQETSGDQSLNVAVTNTGDGAQISLTNLIAGDTYIVSVYVQAGNSLTDILMTCANGATSTAHGNSGTGYGAGGYGAGFYGGNPPPAGTLATGQWFRIYTTFQPTDSTATLQITANATAPTQFWIDAVLVEAGQALNNYFDGSFGKNYFWETGGTPGLTRSYYYDEFGVKSQAVLNILSHHTPLGISFLTPIYNQPYTQ